MITVERTFDVDKAVDTVVEYLKDFAHAEQWDPATTSCRQESNGPVEVGTTWHNVCRLKGQETELTYELVLLDPGHIVFEGHTTTATSTDDIVVAASPEGGSTITYRAQLRFHSVAKVSGPFLDGEFERLGDTTAHRMADAISRLG